MTPTRRRAESVGPTAPERAVLDAFAWATARESHNLARWPGLVWQQLYNRLRWEGKLVQDALEPSVERRSRVGATPWLRLRTPICESRALLLTLEGHQAPVTGCAFAPDGSIVSAGADGTLKVWDGETGTVRSTLLGHDGPVTACAVGPDGSIVSAGADGTLKVWDGETGTVLATLLGHDGPVTACAIGPDGACVVSASEDTTLRVWDLETGSERTTLTGHTQRVTACAISPDGAWVVSASDDATLRSWDLETGAQRVTLVGHEGPVAACAISPDAASIVSGSDDRTLKIWDPQTGAVRATLAGHRWGVWGCAVGPNADYVVSASADMSLRVWDLGTGQEQARLVGHNGWVRACAVSPDGSLLVSAGRDLTLRTWDMRAMVEPDPDAGPAPEDRHTGGVSGCAFSPDGTFAVSASHDGTLKIWEAETWCERSMLLGHTDAVWDCAVSSDAANVASASFDGTVRLWGVDGGDELQTLLEGAGPVFDCDISPDISYAVAAASDGKLRILGLAGASDQSLAGHAGPVTACAVSPDAAFIVSASHDRTLRIWRDGVATVTLAGHRAPVVDCAVSPDERFVASASLDGTVRIWDPGSGMERRALTGHAHQVHGCAVSPDALLVFSAGVDKTVRVWDAESGVERAILAMPGEIACIAAHPTRPTVVFGDGGGNVHAADIVGLELGPIVVTPIDLGSGVGYQVRCPFCRTSVDLRQEWLGTEIGCPHEGCGERLRVNPFRAPVGARVAVPHAPARSPNTESALLEARGLFRMGRHDDAAAILEELAYWDAFRPAGGSSGTDPESQLLRLFVGYLKAIAAAGGGVEGLASAEPVGGRADVDRLYWFLTSDELDEAKRRVRAGELGPAALVLLDALEICPRYPLANYMLAMEAFLWLREGFSTSDPPPVEDAVEVLEAARVCANLGMVDPELADESGKVLDAIEQNLETLAAHPSHRETAALEGLQRDYTSMMEEAGSGITTEAQFDRVRASLRKLEAKAHDAASVVRSTQGKEALARFGSLLAERRREVGLVAASLETAHELERAAEPYVNRLNRSVRQLGQHPVGSAGFIDVLGEILGFRQEIEDERARPGADRDMLDQVLAACDVVLSQAAAAMGGDRGPMPSPGKKRHWWSR